MDVGSNPWMPFCAVVRTRGLPLFIFRPLSLLSLSLKRRRMKKNWPRRAKNDTWKKRCNPWTKQADPWILRTGECRLRPHQCWMVKVTTARIHGLQRMPPHAGIDKSYRRPPCPYGFPPIVAEPLRSGGAGGGWRIDALAEWMHGPTLVCTRPGSDAPWPAGHRQGLGLARCEETPLVGHCRWSATARPTP